MLATRSLSVRKFGANPSRESTAALIASLSPKTIVVWFMNTTLKPLCPMG